MVKMTMILFFQFIENIFSFYMRVISIHSAPRSGSTYLNTLINAHPNIKTLYQPLFSHSFKNNLDEDSSRSDYDNFIDKLPETDNEFCLSKSNLHTNEGQITLPKFDKSITKHIYTFEKFVKFSLTLFVFNVNDRSIYICFSNFSSLFSIQVFGNEIYIRRR